MTKNILGFLEISCWIYTGVLITRGYDGLVVMLTVFAAIVRTAGRY